MLKVIGLGYPRTGTMSLKHALEILGLGPCYHMIEVFQRPQDVPFWLEAQNTCGEGCDWEQVFRGFPSTADCPACCFWPTLTAAYPNAQYILSVRDSNAWYDSFRATVYEAMMHPERAPDEAHRQVQCMARRLILDGMFEGRFDDRDYAIQKYEHHNKAVVDSLPADQLLVFQVAEGWQPLCDFLNLPTPDQPFPRSNSRKDFQQRFTVSRQEN